MPQESLRSVVYRSFVTCEDPRGVIEGKTIRISKTGSTKMKSRKPEKESQSKSSQSKSSKEKEKMSLVEVKNGAQKLNQAIDSWSNGVSFRSFKSQPKDIANDLLKGALDLQESLLMLGKLQEASCMPSSKKKHETQSEENFSRVGSDRFESFRSYDSSYQNERKSANGSSKDCFMELREVIKDGLSKQNLLPPNKSYRLSPDIASTSSSRSSSMMYSTHEFTSSDSISSRATEEKSKGSNLIAKLMGLEEFPSKPARKESDVTSKMQPVFDVDLPNVKKPEFFVQKSDREHMSLDEIITMMQTKGLLRTNKQEINQTSKRSINDAPPIVLMRPQRLGPDNHNVKVYDNPIRKLHQEKAKTEDKSVENRGKSKSPSNKPKASVPVVAKPQRKQEIEKKIDRVRKMAPPVKRKTVENAKSTNLISKNVSLKQVNPQRSVHQNAKSSSVVSTNKLKNQMKNIKTEKQVNESLTTMINSPNQEETQDSEVAIRETADVRHQSPNKAFRKDSYQVRDVITSTDQPETRNNQEHSSAAASDIDKQKARILKTINVFQDSEPANFELFQDCIHELLTHENNERQNPWIQRSILRSRVCVSEDHMIKQIAKKFKSLRNNSECSNESSCEDAVFGLLERDLNSTTIGGAWGTAGWKDGCTVNEVEETVLDLEKIVLSRLIDEILLELVSMGRFV